MKVYSKYKCPDCGWPKINHDPEEGKWTTSPWVSCANAMCDRHESNQRHNKMWYVEKPMSEYRGGPLSWKLWNESPSTGVLDLNEK